MSLEFFFSSRRRHTRCSRDWSSDVCSSDLRRLAHQPDPGPRRPPLHAPLCRRSEERRVGKSVDLGGRRIIKKKRNRTGSEDVVDNYYQSSRYYSDRDASGVSKLVYTFSAR